MSSRGCTKTTVGLTCTSTWYERIHGIEYHVTQQAQQQAQQQLGKTVRYTRAEHQAGRGGGGGGGTELLLIHKEDTSAKARREEKTPYNFALLSKLRRISHYY